MSCSVFVCHPSRCGHDLKWLSHVTGTLPKSPEGKDQPKPMPDIQAILTVLGRRTRIFRQGEEQRLDLSHTDLPMADLTFAQLQETDLMVAQLHRANLEGAQLQSAGLSGAYLEGAFLANAQLQSAGLRLAQLHRANLEGAQLQSADLSEAQLQGACLEGTQLEKANLEGAHLEGAHGLTVEQLATAETLYNAHLDPPLLEQIRQQSPQLLEQPRK
jgi:uncharacterized protein YjbI with pentapeptide repeats